MSAYKRIECALKNRETLLKALAELGFEPEVYDTAQKLRGYTGGERSDTAEIVVPRAQLNKVFTGASNDLGFAINLESNNYEMIVSEYDVAYGIGSRVIQAYATVAIQTALEENGFEVESGGASLLLKKRQTVQVVGQKLI